MDILPHPCSEAGHNLSSNQLPGDILPFSPYTEAKKHCQNDTEMPDFHPVSSPTLLSVNLPQHNDTLGNFFFSFLNQVISFQT